MKLTEKLSLIHQLQETLSQYQPHSMEVFSKLNDMAKEITDSDRSSFFLYDPKSIRLASYIAHGLSTKIDIALGEGIVGSCALYKQPIIENDVDATKIFNPEIDLSSGYVTRNTLTVPILTTNNDLLGVIQVLNKHSGDYDDTDEQLLVKLTQVALGCMRQT